MLKKGVYRTFKRKKKFIRLRLGCWIPSATIQLDIVQLHTRWNVWECLDAISYSCSTPHRKVKKVFHSFVPQNWRTPVRLTVGSFLVFHSPLTHLSTVEDFLYLVGWMNLLLLAFHPRNWQEKAAAVGPGFLDDWIVLVDGWIVKEKSISIGKSRSSFSVATQVRPDIHASFSFFLSLSLLSISRRRITLTSASIYLVLS